jgi:uncharacterized protein
MITIPLSLARKLTLNAQSLLTQPTWVTGKEGVAQVVETLGYIQIDSIAVIQRSHQHTLWSRVPGYTPAYLDELQACDRRIFEYWRGSGVSFLPMADYRFYRYLMEKHAGSERSRAWMAQNQPIIDHVLGRLRDEGPLPSSKFAAPEGFIRGTWWNWKPAKAALEMLLDVGQVMVDRRDHFARVYALSEHVLPKGMNYDIPGDEEMADFAARRALRSLGIITAQEAAWGLVSKAHAAQAVARLVESGYLVAISVESLTNTVFYISSTSLQNEPAVTTPPRLHILAPFDNLIIARSRLKKLFGMDYHLECYLPVHKRKVGYYSLPVLWGEQFMARLDPKANRSTKTLIVRNIVLEPGVDGDALSIPLAQKLADLARFNGCHRVTFEHSAPEGYARLMAARMESLFPTDPEENA